MDSSTPERSTFEHEEEGYAGKEPLSSSSIRRRDRDGITSPLSSPTTSDNGVAVDTTLSPTRLFPGSPANQSTKSRNSLSPRRDVSTLGRIWRKADSFLSRSDMLTLCLAFIVINSAMTIYLITELNTQDLQIPTTNEFSRRKNNHYETRRTLRMQNENSYEQGRIQPITRVEEHKSSTIMVDLGYEPRPKVFGYYFESAFTSQLSTRRLPVRLPIHWENTIYDLYPSKRAYEEHWIDKKGKDYVQNSANYNDEDGERRTPLTPYADTPECKPMHEWQTMSFPTCNVIHEKSMFDFAKKKNKYHTQLKLLGNGYFRDTYRVRDSDGETSIALKTIRYKRRYDGWMYDRHNMDAMVMERMTKSPNIIDIYGFCGFSGLFEFADGGDVESFLDFKDKEEVPSNLELLRIAVDMARALADLHTIESKNGYSSIAHADIYTTQFVLVDGKIKLNDFNRCNFMYWNTTSNDKSCPYYWQDYNAGPFRSPEEYKYDLQSEKIDVYSFGNILYVILTGEQPFEREEEELGISAVMENIGKGAHPLNTELVTKVMDRNDPVDNILVHAIKMCHVYRWQDRASASEVHDYLAESLQSLERGSKRRRHH